MTCYVDVTHEACWIINRDGRILIYHAGKPALVKDGYKVSGVPGQPWTFKVLMKVETKGMVGR